jgi:hypothetical protein
LSGTSVAVHALPVGDDGPGGRVSRHPDHVRGHLR